MTAEFEQTLENDQTQQSAGSRLSWMRLLRLERALIKGT